MPYALSLEAFYRLLRVLLRQESGGQRTLCATKTSLPFNIDSFKRLAPPDVASAHRKEDRHRLVYSIGLLSNKYYR